jgi:hypothetical protein
VVDLVEVEIRTDPITVRIPEVSVGEGSIPTPNIPRFDPDLPPVPIPVRGETRFTLPEFTVPVPTIREGETFIPLPSLPDIFYVEDVDVGLRVETETFDFLGLEGFVTLPTDVELIGPDVEFAFKSFDLPVGLEVPSVDVGTTRRRFGGDLVTLPGIDIEREPLPLPSLGPIEIPDIPVPEVRVDPDGETVRVPTQVVPDVSVNTAEFRRVLLGPLPAGLLEDPPGYVFTAVVAEFESRIGDGLLGTLRRLVNSILESALSEETRQRLRDRAEE